MLEAQRRQRMRGDHVDPLKDREAWIIWKDDERRNPVGAGRFARIGIPWPDTMGPLVGLTETVCGALIILGLATRLAAIPLIVIMLVAIVSTKIPILLGQDFGIFHFAPSSRTGFWSMLHEARADFDMLLGCIYLLIVGGGAWSLDARIASGPGRRAACADA